MKFESEYLWQSDRPFLPPQSPIYEKSCDRLRSRPTLACDAHVACTSAARAWPRRRRPCCRWAGVVETTAAAVVGWRWCVVAVQSSGGGGGAVPPGWEAGHGRWRPLFIFRWYREVKADGSPVTGVRYQNAATASYQLTLDNDGSPFVQQCPGHQQVASEQALESSAHLHILNKKDLKMRLKAKRPWNESLASEESKRPCERCISIIR